MYLIIEKNKLQSKGNNNSSVRIPATQNTFTHSILTDMHMCTLNMYPRDTFGSIVL